MTWPSLDAPSAFHQLKVVVDGPADPPRLQACLDQTDAFCVECDFGEDDAMAIKLCVDEVCANVVSYAYADAGGEPITDTSGRAAPHAAMRLEVWHAAQTMDGTPSTVVLRVMDRGIAFDPSQTAAPDLEASLEDRIPGGLGWFLVHEVMDESRYERTPDGFNVSTLCRRLRGAAIRPDETT